MLKSYWRHTSLKKNTLGINKQLECLILSPFINQGSEFWGKGTMKLYACREIEYKKVKLKHSKIVRRQGKGKRGLAVDSRPSLADHNNKSLILEDEDSVNKRKRAHGFDSLVNLIKN